jgi:hypothetical protein
MGFAGSTKFESGTVVERLVASIDHCPAGELTRETRGMPSLL